VIATARTAFSSSAAILYAERLAKKKEVYESVINFAETDKKRSHTFEQKVNKVHD